MSYVNPQSLLRRDSISVLSFLTYSMPVEPIAILTTVLATANAVHAWLKDKDRKQTIIADLTKVMQTLCEILQPLQKNTGKLDKNVISILLDVAEVLSSTKEHLALWQAKTTSLISVLGFLAPGKVVEFLRDDQARLKERITLLILALQVAAMPDVNTVVETPGEDAKVLESPEDYLEGLTNHDVQEFWKHKFSQDIFVFDSDIPAAIGQWIQQDIDENFGSALIRAIDPKDIGVTTPKSLAKFAGDKTIKEAVKDLRDAITARDNRRSSAIAMPDVSQPPLLVWIDDVPQNNTREVAFAKQLGISVIQIPSTAVARVWIEANDAHLKQLESLNKLRFITDNARWEKDDRKGEFMNMTAGQWTLRFLRSQGFTSPVLVYAGRSIGMTRYVLSFSRAGSTVNAGVCLDFISELANGTEGHRWQGFAKLV